MEITCQNCNEPWDLYYIMHEENVISDIDESNLDDRIISHGFTIFDICGGWCEVPEGYMILEKCPCCRGQE